MALITLRFKVVVVQCPRGYHTMVLLNDQKKPIALAQVRTAEEIKETLVAWQTEHGINYQERMGLEAGALAELRGFKTDQPVGLIEGPITGIMRAAVDILRGGDGTG